MQTEDRWSGLAGAIPSRPLYIIVSAWRDLAAFCELIAAGLVIQNDARLAKQIEKLNLQSEKFRDTPNYFAITNLLGFFKAAAENKQIDVTNQPRLNKLVKLL